MPAPKPTASISSEQGLHKFSSYWKDERTLILLAVIALLIIGIGVMFARYLPSG